MATCLSSSGCGQRGTEREDNDSPATAQADDHRATARVDSAAKNRVTATQATAARVAADQATAVPPEPQLAVDGASVARPPAAEPSRDGQSAVPDPPAVSDPPAVPDPLADRDALVTNDEAAPQSAKSSSGTASEPADDEAPRITSKATLAKAELQSAALAGSAGPEQWRSWPQPQVALVVTGNQHGYIEPCGCTGLENQKGGLARRMTFIRQLTDLGWQTVPLDAGNQVRRFGRQAEIKFQTTAAGLEEMKYQAVGFGPDDLRLGVGELVAVAAAENDPQQGMFVSANVTLIDPSLTAQYKVIPAGGRRIGVTSVLDPEAMEIESSGEIEVGPIGPAMTSALQQMNAEQADFRVLMFYGEEEAAAKAVQQVAGFDIVIVAGGYGEPLYRPQAIENSETKMIVTGNKGMYAGILAIYSDADQPYRYARVPMTHDFEDAPEMRRLMASYQNQLEAIGLAGLGLRPIPHPSGGSFVGSKTCGECHKTAYGIWDNTPHAMATDSIVDPRERGDVPRHFDPECLSCHVTGWNPQHYYPYESGYLSLEASAHLTGSGCENCHGPGAAHVDAERAGGAVSTQERDSLRMAMRLPLDKAKDVCLQCHDLDNSPDFHKEGAFDDYWGQIEHYGLD